MIRLRRPTEGPGHNDKIGELEGTRIGSRLHQGATAERFYVQSLLGWLLNRRGPTSSPTLSMPYKSKSTGRGRGRNLAGLGSFGSIPAMTQTPWGQVFAHRLYGTHASGGNWAKATRMTPEMSARCQEWSAR